MLCHPQDQGHLHEEAELPNILWRTASMTAPCTHSLYLAKSASSNVRTTHSNAMRCLDLNRKLGAGACRLSLVDLGACMQAAGNHAAHMAAQTQSPALHTESVGTAMTPREKKED